jgi:transcriptional antiterminator NusG
MTSFDDTTTTDAPGDEAADQSPEDAVTTEDTEASADPLGALGSLAVEDDETAGDADVVAFLTQKADEPEPEVEAEPEPEAEVVAEAEAGPEVADEPEAEPEIVDNPYFRPGKWYVVHTQSGYEKKVQQNLQARTQSMNMEESIHEVVIPMEDVAEFKQGKKVIVQKKVFPGYLLVRCQLNDDSWFVIRNTPGVTGFVGHGNKPTPLPRKDVEAFLQVKKEGEDTSPKRTKPRLEYEINETVRVKEGPFADFSGEIVEINEDQLKVKVLVNIFGRETPVELEFSQVAKL